MTNAEFTWVEVEVQKGSLVSVYRGRMSNRDLEAWRGSSWIKVVDLHDVHWSSYDDATGGEMWIVLGVTPGPYANATGKLSLRADLILVVVELAAGDDEYNRLCGRQRQQ